MLLLKGGKIILAVKQKRLYNTYMGRPRKTKSGVRIDPITGKADTGRPSKFEPETIKKLEEAFAIDASVDEACFYADISKVTFYDWIKKNEEFSNRIEALRNRPVLKARQTIVKSLDDPEHSKWYLARKRKKEFSERQEVTGEDGGAIKISWE